MGEEQWFHPKVHTGWDKDDPAEVRRRKVLKAHKGNELSAARSMQALANVTQDRQTAVVARSDAKFLFRVHKKQVRAKQKAPRLSR